jgi:hypothetical protein
MTKMNMADSFNAFIAIWIKFSMCFHEQSCMFYIMVRCGSTIKKVRLSREFLSCTFCTNSYMKEVPFTAWCFKVLKMNRDLSTGGQSKSLVCILKGFRKRFYAVAPAGTHYGRRNTRRHCHHGRDTFVVLIVR